MNPKRKIGLLFFVLTIVVSMLACSVGAKPTETPVPPTNTPKPTNTPVPPTNTPVPPTETPVPPTATTEPTTPPDARPTDSTGQGTTTGGTGIVEGALNVIAVAAFKDQYGSWRFTGLVSNNTERAVDDIEIEVEVFDANNNPLYKNTTYTELWTLAQGDVTPFYLYAFEDLPDADHFVATIVGQGSAEIKRADISVQGVRMMADDNGQIYLVGELVNNGGGPAAVSNVAGALFNSAGELVTGVSDATLLHYLEAGEAGPFALSFSVPDDAAKEMDTYTYEIYIDSAVSEGADKLDIVGADNDHNNYLDAYNNLHLVGEVTNNSDKVVAVSLIAAVYDAEGNVLDVSFASTPFYSMNPGELMPYDFSYWGLLNNKEGLYDEKADKYVVYVDWYLTYESYSEQVVLTTSDDSNEFDGDQITFKGNVVNNTGGAVESIYVAVAIYDKETKQIIATGYSYVYDIDELADQASGPYEVDIPIFEDYDPAKHKYVIFVKASKP